MFKNSPKWLITSSWIIGYNRSIRATWEVKMGVKIVGFLIVCLIAAYLYFRIARLVHVKNYIKNKK